MDIFNFKCKYCGGELSEIEGLKSVGKCKYCGSKQTLPKLENEKRANLFERANHLRRNNEFDKAEALYEQLLNEDLSDPEAYWSLVLCRYGIEYVEDTRTKERKPTVNRMQMTSILGDEDYKSAIANADEEQKKLYEEEAKLINEIQKGILEIARKEEPFDIFICYKETDSGGKRSRDSILAQDLYHELTRDGYKVFFARVTLQGKLGSAYEPYIFSALNSAKVMVVLGTKKEHFEAVWVRNEWSRFLGQIKKGERKVLIPAYRDMDAYDLPVEFSNLQALDMSRLGFLQELVEAVENILKSYKKKDAPREEPEEKPKTENAKKVDKKKEPKKKSKAVPIIIIALILVLGIGAGVVFGGGLLNPSGPDETEPGRVTETEKPQGDVDTSSKLAFTKLGTSYYVSGIGSETSKTVVIPSTYEDLPVTSVGYGAFSNCTKITEVIVPSSVKTIGAGAFENCSSLEKITLTNTITNIAANAFRNCSKLSKISFEGTQAQWRAITKGDNWDFGLPSCTVECSDSDIVIGAETGNETVTGGEETTEQTPVEGQFEYQINDEGNGYSIIGIGTVTSSDIVIPSEYNGLPVVRIGIKAFHQCTNITSVTIPNSIAGIGSSAFKDCTSLTTVTIGKDLANIASDAFAGCTAITTVNFGGSQTDWEGISISSGNTALTGANIIFAEAGETELEIDNPVTTLEEGVAYYGVLAHKNLGKLVYLNGLMDGEYYLGEADEIGFAVKVYFEKAPEINYYMYFLEGSTKVYVNVNVSGQYLSFSLDTTAQTVWHYNETYKCPMTNINGELIFIGTSNTGSYTNFCAKRIADGPDFFKLQLVKAGGSSEKPAESLAFELDEATDTYAVTGIGTVSGEAVVIPSTYNGKPVKSIAAHAFDKNIQMKSLYIPKSIVFIDEYAFNDCIYLSQLTYEGSYEEYMEINTSIWGNDSLRNEGMKMDYGQVAADPEPENYDFSFVWAPDGKSFYVAGIWNLENRTNIKIPEFHKGLFVTGINDYAFAAQGEMTSVYIPWSVTVIEEGAFAECTNLALVQFEGTEGDWNNIKINSDNNQLIKANIEYEVIREETCGHDGGETVDVSDGCKVKCSMCGEDLGMVSHSEITFVEEKAPTEEASGYSMYMCGVCKSTWIEEIPPLGDSGGTSSGTVVSVSDATGLVYVIDQINSGGERNDVTIRLEADIDMSGVTFTPIKEFRGTIDGNGKTISNIMLPLKGASITITDGNYTSYSITAIGFIASAYDATVRNLILDNVTVEFNTDKTIFIGALVGYADGLTVENCTVNSTMDVTVGSNDTSGVSGLIGYSLDASAQNVRVNCDMVYVGYSTESFAGAMLGAGNIRIQSATIVLDISFTGSKYGHTGYLVGMERTPYGVTLTSMYNSTVSGTLTVDNSMGYCGGAIGQGEYSTIEQMTSSADNNTVNVSVDSNASN